jgi:diacylglycerol O-acyltransferase 2, plant
MNQISSFISFACMCPHLQVHKAFRAPLDPKKRYIFAYMPHGLFPAGAGYCTHLPSWRKAFPGIAPHVLCANIMHYIPILRDLGAWLGFRQVTRSAFVHALRTDGHILMCPGGQRELLYADEAWPRADGSPQTVRLCVHHKGFCSVAIETGAALVPILCFGELLQLRNAVSWPWLQRHTYRRIGMPFCACYIP